MKIHWTYVEIPMKNLLNLLKSQQTSIDHPSELYSYFNEIHGIPWNSIELKWNSIEVHSNSVGNPLNIQLKSIEIHWNPGVRLLCWCWIVWPGFYLGCGTYTRPQLWSVTNVVAFFPRQVFHDLLNSCYCSYDWAGLRPSYAWGLGFDWNSSKFKWNPQWAADEIHWNPWKFYCVPMDIQWNALKSIGNP